MNLSTYQKDQKGTDILWWNDKETMWSSTKPQSSWKKHTHKQGTCVVTTFLRFNRVLTCRQTSTAPAMFVATVARYLRCWGRGRCASTTPLSVEQMMLLKGVPEVCQTLIMNMYGHQTCLFRSRIAGMVSGEWDCFTPRFSSYLYDSEM